MRVLFLSRRFFPTISGMSVYALNLLRELVREKVDVTLIAEYRADARGGAVYGWGPPMPVEGVTVVGAESKGEVEGGDFERDIDALVALGLREHARTPFDLIHAQYGYPTGLAALELGRRTGLPTVVSIQGGDGHWVGTCCAYHRCAMQAVLDHAGAILIGSASFAAEVSAHNGTSPSRFTFVPGAVDTKLFHPRVDRTLGAFHDARAPHFLFHGRVDARKGALDLVDAFADVPAPARLTISGIGPDHARVAERIRERGLGTRIDLTGYVAYGDVPNVYRGADLFVSPTYAEGFSNTILEAMASGLPVLSTRAVGVVDCVRNEENGLLVEPEDVRSLTVAMRRLLEDETLRTRLAAAAHAEVVSTYAWSEVSRRIIDVYQSLRGTAPATAWSLPAVDRDCRYRREPHLL